LDNSAAFVVKDDETVEQEETCRRDDEEIDSGDVAHVVLEECSPCLRRRIGITLHVLFDGRFGDVISQ
jgi:hypothetical protein